MLDVAPVSAANTQIKHFYGIYVKGDRQTLQQAVPEFCNVHVQCPHGAVVTYAMIDDVPTESAPMPGCEHDCWAVKYKDCDAG